MNHGVPYVRCMAPPDVSEKPPWLRTKVVMPSDIGVRDTLGSCGLRTVCDSSRCPNLGECWGRGHATFMILGDRCTRSCRFCAVPSGGPLSPDLGEPERIAEAVGRLGLRHVVITSVTRDDLPDGGAGMFSDTVRQIRWNHPGTRVEPSYPTCKGTAGLWKRSWNPPRRCWAQSETVRLPQWIRDRRFLRAFTKRSRNG